MADIKESLMYSNGHLWVKKLTGLNVMIGISDHAQEDLGDIVFIDIPKMGTEVIRGKEAGAIESVKTVSPLRAPISGKIVERNVAAKRNPKLINSSPYEKGWLYVVEVRDMTEVGSLMSAKKYREFLENQ